MRRMPARPRLDRFWRVLLVIVAVAFVVRVGYVAGAKRGPCPVRAERSSCVGEYPQRVHRASNGQASDQVFYNARGQRDRATATRFTAPFPHPGRARRRAPADRGAPAAHGHGARAGVVGCSSARRCARSPTRRTPCTATTLYTHVREQRYAMAVLGTLLVLLVGLLGRRVGGMTVGLGRGRYRGAVPGPLGERRAHHVGDRHRHRGRRLRCCSRLRLLRRPSSATRARAGRLRRARDARPRRAGAVPPVARDPGRGAGRRAGRALVARARLAVRRRRALAVIGPWVGYNLARFDERTFVSTNDGIALAGSNCDPVYSGGAIGLTCSRRRASTRPTRPATSRCVAKVYRTRAIDYMKAHKRAGPRGRRGARRSHLEPVPPDGHAHVQPGRRPRAVGHRARAGRVLALLLAVAVAGGVVLAGRAGPPALWVAASCPRSRRPSASRSRYGQTRFRRRRRTVARRARRGRGRRPDGASCRAVGRRARRRRRPGTRSTGCGGSMTRRSTGGNDRSGPASRRPLPTTALRSPWTSPTPPRRPAAGARAAPTPKVVIIGAGPAGLTAAYQLSKSGHRVARSSSPTPSSAGSAARSNATAGVSTSAATASSRR